MVPQQIHMKKALDSLPDEWPDDLRSQIKRLVGSDGRKIVVLDGDITGTQTVYGLPVLTQWSVEMRTLPFIPAVRSFPDKHQNPA